MIKGNVISNLYKILIIGLVVMMIFQPDFGIDILKKLYENTLWIVVLLISSGMTFLMLRRPNMVYYSFLGAIAITLYLKTISNSNLILPVRDVRNTTFKIMHFNVFEFEGDDILILKSILKYSPDIISFGELTPEVNSYLKTNLQNDYPNISELNRIDSDSKLVMSKFPITAIDTFMLLGHPQLNIMANINSNNINLVFPYILPYNLTPDKTISSNQLDVLSKYIHRITQYPIIVVGEFNQVYWSKNLRNFIYDTKLNNTRRFVYPFSSHNSYDHIFYSDHFKCLGLDEIFDSNTNLSGVIGSFEIKNENVGLTKN